MTSYYRHKASHKTNCKVSFETRLLVCTKVKYGTESAARKAMKARRTDGIRDYYRCRHCGEWHLTSQRSRTRLGNKLPYIPPDEWAVVMEMRRLLVQESN